MELRKLPEETEWVEFKHNNSDPETIGENLSALSNSAALNAKANGYVVWGIADGTHEIVGTDFRAATAKKGNEPLETWLLRLLNPRLYFRFHEFDCDGKRVVLLEVPRATGKPVQFAGTEFVRVGPSSRKLKDYPEKERELWRIFDQKPFEELVAADHLDAGDVVRLLDYPAYFHLLHLPAPSNRDNIVQRLAEDRLIVQNNSGGWDSLNLGAILYAKDLSEFRSLQRKAVRVVVYEGKGRLRTLRE